ncbi:uncharacterized protein EDB91DRAFT_1088748 [Suillus paluster]|uniref:uncharacterized protein n=1 Tax=Suillus paluster TaxID=48578 RepID=UPI001B876206|nr:uncharacterized protein EDB91DRAFT_1088748 [Suillus paluster]KAG1720658.1 hypothetical protein EDB91DRAFT_1088748 [Suillus paluster]
MYTVAQVPISQNNCGSASCFKLVQFALIQSSVSLNKIYVTPPQLPWDQRDLKVFMALGPCDVSQAETLNETPPNREYHYHKKLGFLNGHEGLHGCVVYPPDNPLRAHIVVELPDVEHHPDILWIMIAFVGVGLDG